MANLLVRLFSRNLTSGNGHAAGLRHSCLAGLILLLLFSPPSFAKSPFVSFCTNLFSSVFPGENSKPKPHNFNAYIVNLARDNRARSQGFPSLQTEFHRDTLADLIKHSAKYAKDASKDKAHRSIAEALAKKLTELSSSPTLDRIDFLAAAKLFSVLFTDFNPEESPGSKIKNPEIDLQDIERESGSWSEWFNQKVAQGQDFSKILHEIRRFTKENQVQGQLRFPNHQLDTIEDFEVFWDEDVAPILTKPGVELIDGTNTTPIAKAIHDEAHAKRIRNTDSRRLASKSAEKFRELIKNTPDPQLKTGLRLMYWVFSHELNIPLELTLELGRSPSIFIDNGPVHGQHIIDYAKDVLHQGVFGKGLSQIEIAQIANRGYEAFVTAYLNMNLQTTP